MEAKLLSQQEIKIEWQKHNRDHGLSWNEVAELVNEVAAQSQGEAKEIDNDIREWIGGAMYDEAGQMIFRGVDKDNLKQFLDVRGWGSLTSSGMSSKDAAEFQDRVGEWVANVINTKLGYSPQTGKE
jgi:hypothetical protein